VLADPPHPGLAQLVARARTTSRDHVAVVTGASRGIGLALTEHLISRGWRVAGIARTVPSLQGIARAHPRESFLPLVADVTDSIAVAEAFAALAVLWRTPDLVVANAGSYTAVGPTWEADPDRWWRDFEVNVRGTHNTMRAALPGMVRLGSGRFVVMSSGMGGSPSPWSSSYGASKAALTQLVGSVNAELLGTGALAFAVSPGMVRTQMTNWPEELISHRPDLATLPDEAFLGTSAICDLISEIACGDLDPLAGRFIHVRDDRRQLLESHRKASLP
jgi:NADP-dependent 3-hydroxy acid dehydrogenase YdfG